MLAFIWSITNPSLWHTQVLIIWWCNQLTFEVKKGLFHVLLLPCWLALEYVRMNWLGVSNLHNALNISRPVSPFLVIQSTHSFPSMPQWVGIRQLFMNALVTQSSRGFMVLQLSGWPVSSLLNLLSIWRHNGSVLKFHGVGCGICA